MAGSHWVHSPGHIASPDASTDATTLVADVCFGDFPTNRQMPKCFVFDSAASPRNPY